MIDWIIVSLALFWIGVIWFFVVRPSARMQKNKDGFR